MISRNLSQASGTNSGRSQDCHGWLALTLVLSLTACVAQPAATPAAPATRPTAISTLPPPVPVRPARARPAPPRPAPAAIPAVANAGAKKLPNLVGLSPDDAIAQMGPPDSTETQGAARTLIWQSGACRLQVAFFLDVSSNQLRALSQSLSSPACASRIAARVSS
jgi:hypothetical protein